MKCGLDGVGSHLLAIGRASLMKSPTGGSEQFKEVAEKIYHEETFCGYSNLCILYLYETQDFGCFELGIHHSAKSLL